MPLFSSKQNIKHKPAALIREKLWSENNGRILCLNYHKQILTFGDKIYAFI